jgi:AbrB family looped-hinge helix DNA binding protein
MSIQKGRIVSGGRVQLPAEFRRAMGLGDGDAIIMELKDGELVVRPYRDVLRRVQEDLARYIPEGVSLSDELIADRRAEAERE